MAAVPNAGLTGTIGAGHWRTSADEALPYFATTISVCRPTGGTIDGGLMKATTRKGKAKPASTIGKSRSARRNRNRKARYS